MSVAILGLGHMGKGLAKRLAGKTELIIGVRDPAEAQDFAKTLPGSVTVTSRAAAAKAADIVILALPFAAALAEAGANGELKGKIVVDMINPVTPDFSGLTIGHTTSASEELQKVLPGSQVVKAFNTLFASLFDAPANATSHVPVFLAGNDAAAVDAVAAIVALAGFVVERTGGLDAARLIEPVGMLNIRLAYGLGRGPGIAPAWVTIAG